MGSRMTQINLIKNRKMRCGETIGVAGSRTARLFSNEILSGENCPEHPTAPQLMWKPCQMYVKERRRLVAPNSSFNEVDRCLAPPSSSSSSLYSAGLLSAVLMMGFFIRKLVCSN